MAIKEAGEKETARFFGPARGPEYTADGRRRAAHRYRDLAVRVLAAVTLVALAAAGCGGPAATPSPASDASPAQGESTSGRLETPPATPPPAEVSGSPTPLARVVVELAFPNLSLPRPVAMAYPEDGTDRLFLALQAGRVVVFPNDRAVLDVATFLDIRDRVADVGREEGLLGLAFDPDYRRNGYLYVYYTAGGPRRSVVSRFTVSAVDPDGADRKSEKILLEVPQPYANHNGGQLVFGPDGYLYIGLGDGGSGGDPHLNGQDPATLLGSILRVDVSSVDSSGAYSIPSDNPFAGREAGARGEVWAFGLRNPWRFTFDRDTGDLWAADVGQDRYEEIDLIRPGLNYGWNLMEGSHCFGRPDDGCSRDGLVLPLVEYGRNEGCSVTGGYVYRGPRLDSLNGAYLYGDFCSGKIWALRYIGGRVTEHMALIDSDLAISSFGEDRSGGLYILSLDGGIYRLAPR